MADPNLLVLSLGCGDGPVSGLTDWLSAVAGCGLGVVGDDSGGAKRGVRVGPGNVIARSRSDGFGLLCFLPICLLLLPYVSHSCSSSPMKKLEAS